MVVNRVTALSSSGRLICVNGVCFGQSAGDCLSQDGPSHQSEWRRSSEGNRPLDAQSAGLSSPFTWFHLSGGINSVMVEILFPTNVLTTRTSIQPVEHNGAVSPGTSVRERDFKYLASMTKKMSQ